MAGASTRAALLLMVVFALCAVGCENGLRVGSWEVFKAKAPMDPGVLEVARTLASEPSADGQKPVAKQQKLVVDLVSGKATFTDVDAKVLNYQVNTQVAAELRKALGAKDWYSLKLPSEASKIPADAIIYNLTVKDAVKPSSRTVSWSQPAAKAVPQGISMVMDSFDQAHRLVHPLSNDINLIK